MTAIILSSIAIVIFLTISTYLIPLYFKQRQPKEQNPSRAILNHFSPVEHEVNLNAFVEFVKGLPKESHYRINNLSNNQEKVNHEKTT